LTRMARRDWGTRVNQLILRGQWDEARGLLEKQREKDPANHWVLTQLGVTFYEQGKYEEALELFLASLRIVDDCPLTLWNLAGTFDALGKWQDAIRIYTWLLASEKTPEEDPCWESQEWADSLKADCVYRLGVCFQELGKAQGAEQYYRQYLALLTQGVEGTYSTDAVIRRIRDLHGSGSRRSARKEIRKTFESALRITPGKRIPGGGSGPPQFSERGLRAGRRVASKIPRAES
jgi:tetratricopeptide (TPR) repeat protein